MSRGASGASYALATPHLWRESPGFGYLLTLRLWMEGGTAERLAHKLLEYSSASRGPLQLVAQGVHDHEEVDHAHRLHRCRLCGVGAQLAPGQRGSDSHATRGRHIGVVWIAGLDAAAHVRGQAKALVITV